MFNEKDKFIMELLINIAKEVQKLEETIDFWLDTDGLKNEIYNMIEEFKEDKIEEEFKEFDKKIDNIFEGVKK